MTAPLAILLIGNVPEKIFANRLLNWGYFSYSLYIVHMQLIVLIGYMIARVWKIEQLQMTSYWMWTLSIPPILAVSWLFYQITEKRCDAALRKIRDREKFLRGEIS